MEVLGNISGQSLLDLYRWVEKQPLDKVVHSNYAPNRIEKWYKFGSNLQSLRMGKHRIFEADKPDTRVNDVGERLYPNWHSLLVCGGDTNIDWHFDHGCFVADAVMINLGEAMYFECVKSKGYQPVTWFEHPLKDGMVVKINTKLLHKSEQISPVRYNLTFRKFKDIFLKDMLV